MSYTHFPSPFLSGRRNRPDPFDHLFQRFFGDIACAQERVRPAPINVTDHEDHLEVTLLAPGLGANDVEVTLDQNVLTLKGTFSRATEVESKVLIGERAEGTFERRLKLPVRIDAAKVTARRADGLFTITLPKSIEATKRSIPIEEAS